MHTAFGGTTSYTRPLGVSLPYKKPLALYGLIYYFCTYKTIYHGYKIDIEIRQVRN
jgi:hypothetical protein